MIRLVSVFTLVCFLLTNVLGNVFAGTPALFPYQYINNSINNNINNNVTNNLLNEQNKFSQYAYIQNSIYKKNTPLAIIINDLHNNIKVQKNIEQIINFISDNSKIDKIILEGAPNKKISTELFSSLNDQKVINDISNSMLEKAIISGAESFIVKNNFQNVYGLEEWDIYKNNIEQNLILKNRYKNDISLLQNYFVRNRIYFSKPKLFSLFSQKDSLNSKVIKMCDFCIKNNIDFTSYSEIRKFITIQKYKNNKYNISKDFKALLEDLKSEISFKTYTDIVDLLKHTDTNTKEKINLIFNIIKNTKPDLLLKYNLLLSYLKDIEAQVELDEYLLLQQINLLEEFLLNNFVEYNQKEFILVDKFIYLLSLYTNLNLTYDQYQYFKTNKEYLYQNSIKYLDTKSIKIINNILKDKELEQYYYVNEERNNIFYNNILKFLDVDNVNNIKETNENIIEKLKDINSVNIIVVGGFHSKLIDMLKQSNVSILSIVPRSEGMTDLDNKILRTDNIVYNNAIRSPIIFVQANLYAIAVAIDALNKIMDSEKVPLPQQKEIIEKWLVENKINVKMEIKNGEIFLNSVPIQDVLKSQQEEIQPQQEETNIEKKKSLNDKLLDFFWYIYSFYLNIRQFIASPIKSIKKLFNKINIFSSISSISSQYISRKLLDERIINNEYDKILNSLNKKMPDVIVITVSNEKDIQFCEDILANTKSHPNFKNTQIQYVRKEQEGTAIGFTKAIQYLKSNNFKKPFKDLTSVIIDIDTNEKENIGRKDLPMQFNGRNITPLELAVLNGIRNCQEFKNGGGIAVIDPQSIYIGNMLATGDITFISSAVNMKEIQNHRHSLVVKDYPDKLQQIYYGFEPENISDIVEKKGIEHKNFYNFDNKLMRQFEVITGNFLITFNEEDKYLEFFDFISQIGDYLQNSPSKMNVFQHIFVPFVRLNHKEKVESYFAKIISKTEDFKDRQFYMGLAGKISNYYRNNSLVQNTKFGVYQQSNSLYSRNFTKQLLDRLANIFKSTQVQLTKSNVKSKIKKKQINITETFNEDTALSRAYKLLLQIQDKQLNSSIDYEQVYEILIEIFRTTSIQKELYTSENANTAKLYRYISDIISNTIAQINEEETNDTNKIEQTYLENLKTSFLAMQHYTIEYLRLLDYTANMSILGSYIYPKNSFFEISKLMPINRKIFGFTRGINKARQDIRKQLATVYLSGNFLIDSLYSFPILKTEMEDFIDDIENPKQRTSVGMQQQWGSRRAIQRFLSLALSFQSFTTTIFGTLMSSSNFKIIALTSAAISLVTGLGLSIFLHRGSIFVGWNNKFYNQKKKEIENELQGQSSLKDSIEFFEYDKYTMLQLGVLYKKLIKSNTISNDNKRLITDSLLLLEQYEANYNLQFISIILKNSKEIYSMLDNGNILKSELGQFINYLDKINVEDDQRKYDGIGKGFVSDTEKENKKIEHYLTNWLNILKNNKIDKTSIDKIIINATNIIKITSFDDSVFRGTNKDTLISQLQDFISFYDKTIEVFSKLSKDQQNELKSEIEILERIGEYALQYYKALNYLVSLEILYGYRISKNNKLHFLEQIGIMPVVRSIYGISSGIFLSKKGFIKSITKVKNIGNEIVNGLYDDRMEKDVKFYLEQKEKPDYFYLGIIESWKNRKMLARFLPLAIFIYRISISLLTRSFSLKSFLISFVTGVGLTIALHWVPIMTGFFKTLFISKEKNPMKQEKNSIEVNRQLLLQKHVDNLSNVPYGQMPDLIIVAGTKTKYTVKDLNDSIRNIRKHGNLKSVPVEPVITESFGTGNTLLDIFDFIQSKQFLKDYPTLSQKDVKDLKIVVVNIDGASSEFINKLLDIEILDKQTTSVELSLLNAIGMIQQNQNGSIVIADPTYMYLGDLIQSDNITLLSSNVTYEQLKNQNLPLLLSAQIENNSQNGSSQLKKLYSSFDDTKISNLAVVHMFNQMYDKENESMIQMPTYSGIISINFSDKQKFDIFLQFMKIAKEYEQNYQGRKFKIDLVQHLLIPLTRLMNGEDLFVYFEALKYNMYNSMPDIKNEYDKFFYGLFTKFNDEFKNEISDSFINVATSHNSVVTKNNFKENSFYDSFISLLGTLKQLNIKETVHKITDNIKSVFLSNKKLGVLVVPQLSSFAKHQIFAFDNELSENIAVTSFNQLSENKKDSNVIINVPVENTIIPAKVFYDTIVDEKGKNHVVVAFMPILFDDIDMYSSVREINFLKSVLSDSTTELEELRKKLFIGRATLSFIQELKTNPQLKFIYEDSDFVTGQTNASFIVSFDDSGVFAIPELIKDRFSSDKNMVDIKHINITTNQKTTNVNTDYIQQFQLSNIVAEYDITSEDKIDLSLLFKLVSNYNFSFYDSDSSTFLNSPQQYAQNILNSVFDTKIIRKDFSNIDVIPIIDTKQLSIKQLEALLQNIKTEKLVLQNMFYSQEHLFDVSSLDISFEIDRLNNPELNKFRDLLDNSNVLSTNKIFVLITLFHYIQKNEHENALLQQFIATRTKEFKRDLDILIAKQLSNKENVSLEDIENIKKENVARWNFYYEINLYMQYISYINYQNIKKLLKDNKVQMVIDLNISQVPLRKVVEQVNYINTMSGIVNFKINGLSSVENQEETINYLRTNITNDILLIFDDITDDINLNNYQNYILVSDNKIQNQDANAIKLNLSNTENVTDLLTDLSKQQQLTTLFINAADILKDSVALSNFSKITTLLKNTDSFDYLQYGKTLIKKYEDDIIADTSNKAIKIVDITDINSIKEEQFLSYVYKVLYEANINDTNYNNLFELLSQLSMQYKYANQQNKGKMVLELKGILLAISDIQQIAEISVIGSDINIQQINSILASA